MKGLFGIDSLVWRHAILKSLSSGPDPFDGSRLFPGKYRQFVSMSIRDWKEFAANFMRFAQACTENSTGNPNRYCVSQ